jgi:hypothetical protein
MRVLKVIECPSEKSLKAFLASVNDGYVEIESKFVFMKPYWGAEPRPHYIFFYYEIEEQQKEEGR